MTRILNYIGSRSTFAFTTYFISFLNLYGISLLFAIMYDDRHENEGGPTAMVAFAIGPLISGVIVLISILILTLVRRKKMYTLIGSYCVFHYLFLLVAIIWFVFEWITTPTG